MCQTTSHMLEMSNPVAKIVFLSEKIVCFGTYFTHVQACDVTRVQNATEWTASVHTSHVSKPVM